MCVLCFSQKTSNLGLVGTGVIRIEEGEKGELTLVAGSPLFLNSFKQMMYNNTLRKGIFSCDFQKSPDFSKKRKTLRDGANGFGRRVC